MEITEQLRCASVNSLPFPLEIFIKLSVQICNGIGRKPAVKKAMLDLVVFTVLSSSIFFQILITFFDKMLEPFCAVVLIDSLNYIFVNDSAQRDANLFVGIQNTHNFSGQSSEEECLRSDSLLGFSNVVC